MEKETAVVDNRKFEKRLRELRGEKNLAEVADAIGISRVSLGYYEQGKRHPDAEILTKLAIYYGVSLDYLVGISDVKSQSAELKLLCHILGLSELAVTRLIKWRMTVLNPDKSFEYEQNGQIFYEDKIASLYLRTIDRMLSQPEQEDTSILLETINDYLNFGKSQSGIIEDLGTGKQFKYEDLNKVGIFTGIDNEDQYLNSSASMLNSDLLKEVALRKMQKYLDKLVE